MLTIRPMTKFLFQFVSIASKINFLNKTLIKTVCKIILYLAFILLNTQLSFAIMPPYKRAQLSACQSFLGNSYDAQLNSEDSINYIKATVRFKGRMLSNEEANTLNSVLNSYLNGHSLRNYPLLKAEFETLVDIFDLQTVSDGVEYTRLLQYISHKVETKTRSLQWIRLLKQKLNPRLIFETYPFANMHLYMQIIRVAEDSHDQLEEIILDLNSVYKVSGSTYPQTLAYKIESDYHLRAFNKFIPKNYIRFNSEEEKVHLQSSLSVYSNALNISFTFILKQIEESYARNPIPINAAHLIEFYDIYSQPQFSQQVQ